MPLRFRLSTLILFLVLAVAPLAYMLAAPFFLQSTGAGPISIFSPRQLGLAMNSLAVAGGAALLSLCLGLPLALLLQKTRFPFQKTFFVLLTVPFLIPPYMHALVWWKLAPWVLDHTGFDLHSRAGCALVLALAYYPLVLLLAAGGLRSIDPELEETALLHKRPRTVIRRVVLPMIQPHVLGGALLVFLFSIIDFGVPDILRVNTYPVEIFIQFSAFYDEKAAALLSLPMILTALVLVAALKKVLGNRAFFNVNAGKKGPKVYGLGCGAFPAALFMAVAVGVAVAVPVGTLAVESESVARFGEALSQSKDAILFSLWTAAAGGLAATLLGFLLAYAVERGKGFFAGALGYAALLPLAAPAVTLGIGLINVWNLPVLEFVYTSSAMVVIGYTARFVPFGFIAAQAGIKQVAPRLEEAAALGSKRFSRVLFRITAPLAAPSLLAAFFITFILSLGELGTTLLVLPPGQETVPLRIYNLMHYGAETPMAALSLLQVLIILICAGLWYILNKLVLRRLHVAGQ